MPRTPGLGRTLLFTASAALIAAAVIGVSTTISAPNELNPVFTAIALLLFGTALVAWGFAAAVFAIGLERLVMMKWRSKAGALTGRVVGALISAVVGCVALREVFSGAMVVAALVSAAVALVSVVILPWLTMPRNPARAR